MRDLRVAIIGCGYVAKYHRAAWAAAPGARLVAVCDRNIKRSKDAAVETGAQEYDDVCHLFDAVQPDIVDVATPPETHASIAIFAAERGAHVLCQKPIAPSLAEATTIVEACERAGVRLMVMEIARHLPWWRAIGEEVASGAVGPVRLLRSVQGRVAQSSIHPVLRDQPHLRHAPRLVVLEGMIHSIDAARWLLGEVESVVARTAHSSPMVAGEDIAVAILKHVGGGVSVHDASWAAPNRPPITAGRDHVLVEGERGILAFAREEGIVWRTTAAGDAAILTLPSLDEAYQGGFNACVQHFVAAIRDGTEFGATARDNLRTLAATLAVYESATSMGVAPLYSQDALNASLSHAQRGARL